jgi:hypothetical protein
MGRVLVKPCPDSTTRPLVLPVEKRDNVEEFMNSNDET